MTHILARSELQALMDQRIGHCISLFPPTYRTSTTFSEGRGNRSTQARSQIQNIERP